MAENEKRRTDERHDKKEVGIVRSVGRSGVISKKDHKKNTSGKRLGLE